MERPERVPQLYGYTVCLVALLWGVGSIVHLVEHTQALAAPAYHRQNDYGFEPSITSFEAFRLTYDRSRRINSMETRDTPLDTIPEADLRRRYETLRADRIAATRVEARQGIVLSTISLLIAAGLFAFHWRWLRRRTIVPGGGVVTSA